MKTLLSLFLTLCLVFSSSVAVATEKITNEEIQKLADNKVLIITSSSSVLVSKRGGWLYLGCLLDGLEGKAALLEVDENLFLGGEYVLAQCWKGFLSISVPKNQKPGKYSDI